MKKNKQMDNFILNVAITIIVIMILLAKYVGVESQTIDNLCKGIPFFISICLLLHFMGIFAFALLRAGVPIAKGKDFEKFKEMILSFPDKDLEIQKFFDRATDVIVYALFALNGFYWTMILFILNNIVQGLAKHACRDCKENLLKDNEKADKMSISSDNDLIVWFDNKAGRKLDEYHQDEFCQGLKCWLKTTVLTTICQALQKELINT